MELDEQAGEGCEAAAEERGMFLWRKEGAGGHKGPALKSLSWEEEAVGFYGPQEAEA